MKTYLSRICVIASALMASATAAYAERIGQSAPGQLNLQEPATPMMTQIYDLHTFMLYIITGITVFVTALLIIVIVRFNKKANPTPASWTHNTSLEVAWTVAPVILLVMIVVPSVKLLQEQEDFEKVVPDLVIKATGYQWYWGYEYPDEGIEFEALMLGSGAAEMNDEVREELAEYDYPETAWKLATDYKVVVPLGKTVLMQITGADVIHAWTIPAFGVKADAVPGRLNQTYFRADEVGIYYGQCSELCGANHAYMPITVEVKSEEDYAAWLEEAKEEFAMERAPASTDKPVVELAAR
ncbi:MAG: cytochrome c oxidase subunit II [Rhodobacteraceae bacterium]|nr:cytochrome c oxidase subunit II [Paracoccaceae bacterium]